MKLYFPSDDMTITKGYPVKSDIMEESEKESEANFDKDDLEKDEVDEEKELLSNPPLFQHDTSFNYKDYTVSSSYSLLKPHLLSFFNHVYIDSTKAFDEFSKYSQNIVKLVEKEHFRIENLVSYKPDYPGYLFKYMLGIFTKLMNILRTESLLGEEEEKEEDSGKHLKSFREFGHALMKAILGKIFDNEIVFFL